MSSSCESDDWLLPTRIALLAFAVDVALGIFSVAGTAYTGHIRLDQGQNTYRAALLLARGQNPYGRGTLLDLVAFKTRVHLRCEAGIPAEVTCDQLSTTLDRYWDTLDPELERQLLPLPGPTDSALAHREASILGYKYGPLLFLLALPLTMIFGPASISLLNLVAFLAWTAVLLAILRKMQFSPRVIAVVMASILATYEIPWNFLCLTASDIWPLLFSSLAVLALLSDRPILMGGAIGLALASKIFPAALFVPLLFHTRPLSSVAKAVATSVLVAASLYGPFILWDSESFFLNVVRWPALMAPDSTAWVYYADATIALYARAVIALALLILALRLIVGRDQQLFRCLALLNLLLVLAGTAFHNNYVTWFVPWLFMAMAEALKNAKSLPHQEWAGSWLPHSWLWRGNQLPA
jgi:hypothetical protein